MYTGRACYVQFPNPKIIQSNTELFLSFIPLIFKPLMPSILQEVGRSQLPAKGEVV